MIATVDYVFMNTYRDHSPKERIVLIYQSYHLNLMTVAQLLLLYKYLRHDWKRVQMFLPKVGGFTEIIVVFI